MAKKKADVATPSAAYNTMAPRWSLIATLLGGTEAMRAAGLDYLPQHARESDESYKERLSRAVLKNSTEDTLNSLAARPFEDGVKTKDVPEQIEELFKDVDLRGTSLQVFLSGWFRAALGAAFSHVMVEYPKVEPKADGSQRTKEDDAKDNLRPYLVHIPPENLIFAEAEIINGREVLTHVRIMEQEVKRVEWEQQTILRVRVLDLIDNEKGGKQVQVTLYEQRKTTKGVEWVETDRYLTSATSIPLVTFYTNRTDLMEGKPPLLDLANINVAHWQSASDQTIVLTVARFPMLAISGPLETDNNGQLSIKVGPKTYLHTNDPQGKFYYVEHTGAAIEAGANDLKRLEADMAAYGSQFLRDKPGDVTATGRALDSAEAMSPLQLMVKNFEEAVVQVFQHIGGWLGMEAGAEVGTVELKSNFSPEGVSDAGLQELGAARTRKDISRVGYLSELQARGVLTDAFDAEKDLEQIGKEQDELLKETSDLDLDPLATPPPGSPPPGSPPPGSPPPPAPPAPGAEA